MSPLETCPSLEVIPEEEDRREDRARPTLPLQLALIICIAFFAGFAAATYLSAAEVPGTSLLLGSSVRRSLRQRELVIADAAAANPCSANAIPISTSQRPLKIMPASESRDDPVAVQALADDAMPGDSADAANIMDSLDAAITVEQGLGAVTATKPAITSTVPVLEVEKVADDIVVEPQSPAFVSAGHVLDLDLSAGAFPVATRVHYEVIARPQHPEVRFSLLRGLINRSLISYSPYFVHIEIDSPTVPEHPLTATLYLRASSTALPPGSLACMLFGADILHNGRKFGIDMDLVDSAGSNEIWISETGEEVYLPGMEDELGGNGQQDHTALATTTDSSSTTSKVDTLVLFDISQECARVPEEGAADTIQVTAELPPSAFRRRSDGGRLYVDLALAVTEELQPRTLDKALT